MQLTYEVRVLVLFGEQFDVHNIVFFYKGAGQKAFLKNVVTYMFAGSDVQLLVIVSAKLTSGCAHEPVDVATQSLLRMNVLVVLFYVQ